MAVLSTEIERKRMGTTQHGERQKEVFQNLQPTLQEPILLHNSRIFVNYRRTALFLNILVSQIYQ